MYKLRRRLCAAFATAAAMSLCLPSAHAEDTFPSKPLRIIVAYTAMYAIARFGLEYLRGDADRGFVFVDLLSTSQRCLEPPLGAASFTEMAANADVCLFI